MSTSSFSFFFKYIFFAVVVARFSWSCTTISEQWNVFTKKEIRANGCCVFHFGWHFYTQKFPSPSDTTTINKKKYSEQLLPSFPPPPPPPPSDKKKNCASRPDIRAIFYCFLLLFCVNWQKKVEVGSFFYTLFSGGEWWPNLFNLLFFSSLRGIINGLPSP